MSSVLTEQDILELRLTVEEIFPDTATILRRTEVTSEYGGDTSTYLPVVEGARVLFGIRSARELEQLNVAEAEIDQLFTFVGGVDIRQSDQIQTDAPDSSLYEVLSVGGGGSWEVIIPVAARKVI